MGDPFEFFQDPHLTHTYVNFIQGYSKLDSIKSRKYEQLKYHPDNEKSVVRETASAWKAKPYLQIFDTKWNYFSFPEGVPSIENAGMAFVNLLRKN